MKCRHCKQEIPSSAFICHHCGHRQKRWANGLILAAQSAGLIGLISASASFTIPWLSGLLFHKDEIALIGFPNGRQVMIGNTGDGAVYVSSLSYQIKQQASATRVRSRAVFHTLALSLTPGEIRSSKVNEEIDVELEIAAGIRDKSVLNQLNALAIIDRCVLPMISSPDDQVYDSSGVTDAISSRSLTATAKFYSVHDQQFHEVEIPLRQGLGVKRSPECSSVYEYLRCGQTDSKTCRFEAPASWIAAASKDNEELALVCLSAPEHCRDSGYPVDLSWYQP